MSAEATLLAAIGPELASIARRALRAHLGTPARSWRDEVTADAGLPKLPVFVTLRASGGELRGCIGSLTAQEANVALETARIAVLSATEDPRFDRLGFDEIEALGIEVSVLLPEEPCGDPSELDGGCHAVVVRHASGRQGVLLPGVPGVRNGVEQIAIARRKAGIGPAESVTMGRFAVLKYS